METQAITIAPKLSSDSPLQLSKLILSDDFRKKWNVTSNDFVCLTKNGKLVNESIYRIGGLSSLRVDTKISERYFMLIKYVTAFYDDKITTVKKDKPHLESRDVIIDKNGVEKVVFNTSKNPYLVKDSPVYSINSDYFNIETGQMYCYSSQKMVSDDYIFLNNDYDKDKTKRGVIRINKEDGTFKLYKKS